jgi:hypothetical protein
MESQVIDFPCSRIGGAEFFSVSLARQPPEASACRH